MKVSLIIVTCIVCLRTFVQPFTCGPVSVEENTVVNYDAFDTASTESNEECYQICCNMSDVCSATSWDLETGECFLLDCVHCPTVYYEGGTTTFIGDIGLKTTTGAAMSSKSTLVETPVNSTSAASTTKVSSLPISPSTTMQTSKDSTSLSTLTTSSLLTSVLRSGSSTVLPGENKITENVTNSTLNVSNDFVEGFNATDSGLLNPASAETQNETMLTPSSTIMTSISSNSVETQSSESVSQSTLVTVVTATESIKPEAKDTDISNQNNPSSPSSTTKLFTTSLTTNSISEESPSSSTERFPDSQTTWLQTASSFTPTESLTQPQDDSDLTRTSDTSKLWMWDSTSRSATPPTFLSTLPPSTDTVWVPSTTERWPSSQVTGIPETHSQLTGDVVEPQKLSVVMIVTLSLGILLTFVVLVVVGRRLFNGWQRRHYSKLDYLINGIYN